jgi:hypothetical protein
MAIVVHDCNPNTRRWRQEESGLHRENLSVKKKKGKEGRKEKKITKARNFQLTL